MNTRLDFLLLYKYYTIVKRYDIIKTIIRGEKHMAKLEAEEYKTFEAIKQVVTNGNEFWFARDLQEVLQYTEWRNFSKVIDKAMLSCKNSGFDIPNHFVEVNKMVEIGSGAEKEVIDYKLPVMPVT